MSGYRREDVAPVKSVTGFFEIDRSEPADIELPNLCVLRVVKQRCQQAVIGCNEYVTIIFDQQNFTLRSDARINDGHMYRAARKISVRTANPEAGLWWPLRRDIVCEIDDMGVGIASQYHTAHNRGERAFMTEIGRHRNDT